MTQQTPNEIYKSYADHLKTTYGYCVDLTSTSTFPMLYQPSSNTKLNPQTIVLKWRAYQAQNQITIAKKEYSQFNRDLITGVMSYLPQIKGTGFDAGAGEFFTYKNATLANKYVPYKPDVSGVTINPILFEYFGRLFENEQDQKVVLDFCADIIQNPARKPMWGLLITGEQGCGKSRIPELVKLALGGFHCFIESEYGKAFDQFSEVFVDNLLVAFDDPAKGNSEAYEKLKLDFVRTEKEIEHKGLQIRFTRKSQSRIMMLHNSDRPWIFPAPDRRIYAPQPMTHFSKHNLTGCVKNSAAFFEKFITWQESSSAPLELYKFFSERDLSDFEHGTNIKTETHQKMAQLSISVMDNLIGGFFDDNGNTYRFHENELVDYLKAQGANPNRDSLKLKLTALNYEHKRMTVETDPKEKKEWVWRPIISGKHQGLTSEELSRIPRSLTDSF